jgi:hypothetical protein
VRLFKKISKDSSTIQPLIWYPLPLIMKGWWVLCHTSPHTTLPYHEGLVGLMSHFSSHHSPLSRRVGGSYVTLLLTPLSPNRQQMHETGATRRAARATTECSSNITCPTFVGGPLSSSTLVTHQTRQQGSVLPGLYIMMFSACVFALALRSC